MLKTPFDFPLAPVHLAHDEVAVPHVDRLECAAFDGRQLLDDLFKRSTGHHKPAARVANVCLVVVPEVSIRLGIGVPGAL